MAKHTTAYSPLQIGLHWAIALLIGWNWVFSDGVEDLFDARMEGTAAPGAATPLHIYVGMAVLALVAIRLLFRFLQGVPEEMSSGKAWMDLAGRWSHSALYLLMAAVPILGVMAWYGAIDPAAEMHVLVMNVMMILILVHSLAAIYHQVVLRDGLLMRMVRGR